MKENIKEKIFKEFNCNFIHTMKSAKHLDETSEVLDFTIKQTMREFELFVLRKYNSGEITAPDYAKMCMIISQFESDVEHALSEPGVKE